MVALDGKDPRRDELADVARRGRPSDELRDRIVGVVLDPDELGKPFKVRHVLRSPVRSSRWNTASQTRHQSRNADSGHGLSQLRTCVRRAPSLRLHCASQYVAEIRLPQG
jgi:hypothetical protein